MRREPRNWIDTVAAELTFAVMTALVGGTLATWAMWWFVRKVFGWEV